MSESELIEEMLFRWENARQRGECPTVEILCADCPNLVDAVRARIDAVAAMEHVLGLHDDDDDQHRTVLSEQAQINRTEHLPHHHSELPRVPGYEILRLLDEGGMGVVYQARQSELGRIVALKMISGPRLSARQIVRFKAEAEAAAHLQHANIVQIFDIGQIEGRPFFSMEYIAGGSLASLIAAGPWAVNASNRRKSVALLITVARAAHFAHQRGIVHRDLKPSNLLLTADGVVKIADFGLAKRLDVDPGHTGTGEVLGTPSYMAPEQAEGRKDLIGPATDVYALGAILYEMLTGQPPFCGESLLEGLRMITTREPIAPSKRTPSTPRDLEAICLKCLEKSPARRYASAEALADDLQRFLDDRPIHARPTGPLQRFWKLIKRHPQWTAAVAALALLFAVAGWVGVREYREQTRVRERAIEVAPQVREILSRNCLECHGQDARKAQKDLHILDHEQLVKGGRRLVVPGAPADSRLMQRIADGSMPPEEEERRLPRISELELTILRDWILGGAPPLPAARDAGQVPAVVPYSPLAAQARQVFEKYCYECHKYDEGRGGIKILHHRLLLTVRKVVVPGDPEGSELYHLLVAVDDEMRMPPPPHERVPEADIEVIRQWILAGAPPFPKAKAANKPAHAPKRD